MSLHLDPTKHSEIPETKVCSICGQELPMSSFSVDVTCKWGHSARCKTCRALAARKKRKDQPEKSAEAQRKYAQTPKGHRAFRRCALLRSYGMTEADYEQLEANQNDCCAICGEHKDAATRYLCVDHDHKTGKIRGLLCTKCNVGLGAFRDSPETLIKASEYLIRTQNES